MGVLPPEVEEVFNAALVAELTVLDERGRAVTHPLIPLYDGQKIMMTSSVLFSRKLERIKANPHVSVSVTDPVSAVGVEPFRRVTVQGDATVVDDDLHSGWERTVLPLWRVKEPAIDFFLGKRVALPLFFERAVIEIVPRKVFVWEDARTDRAPTVVELAGAGR